ncbi:hypothetical protein GOBAR_AA02945 [Gossypium barbadense]|uniref:Uncharacterized protein n=1 Tax=Gossypium barbadense TaxID=3634 RepID=A0A2P5YPW1_GOSBA|nr:hypothetical protein GOBAR_AA02945 [Gossypium barbadense]
MKPPHELDKRVVVVESVGPRAVGGHRQECPPGLLLGRLSETILGRVGSSVPVDHPHAKHARDAMWRHLADEGTNGDDPLSMPLRLVLNRKARIVGWRARGQSVPTPRGREMPSAAPNSGMLSWRINLPRRNWTVPGLSCLVITVWRWNVEHSSIVSSSSSWGPQGNCRRGWQISAVGPTKENAPFLFFEAGTAVFFPLDDDMVR